MSRYYPDSKVEIQGFSAKHYDSFLNIASLGWYGRFIKRAIGMINISSDDTILDFGAGTGRNALLMQEYLSGKGEILGLEISELMIDQFKKNTEKHDNINVMNQRIDLPFKLGKKYDKVFISFVFHGFPFETQKTIIANAYNLLKDGGEFVVLDFNEFVTENTPLYFRIPFKIIECRYAFEYVERDWKRIMAEFGFVDFMEQLFLRNHLRLLTARRGV